MPYRAKALGRKVPQRVLARATGLIILCGWFVCHDLPFETRKVISPAAFATRCSPKADMADL